MFTQKELNILQQACGEFKGIYPEEQFERLTDKEMNRHKDSIVIAHRLAERFEELLLERHDIERKIEEIEHKAGTYTPPTRYGPNSRYSPF